MRFSQLIAFLLLVLSFVAVGNVNGINMANGENATYTRMNVSDIMMVANVDESSVVYAWTSAFAKTLISIQNSVTDWAVENPEIATQQNIFNIIGTFILAASSYYVALFMALVYVMISELKLRDDS